ncbi:MAG: hypothetical protein IJ390_09495 [Lachnospiraceae bacterium]|nr:hypothetical protein [Lachnospiraceae bacterium]
MAAGVKILEQFTMSKTGRQETNEDRLFINDHFIAVIDGATSKNGKTFMGKTAGQLSAQIAVEVLQELDGTETEEIVIGRIQSAMRQWKEEFALEERGLFLCASAVIYSIERKQIWSVGDSPYSVNGVAGKGSKKVDDVLADARALAIQFCLLEGMTEQALLKEDAARKMILPFLQKQKILENTDGEFGFPVLNGDDRVPKIEIIDVSEGAEVILASDGYPFLEGTLKESEERLKKIITEDPLCYRQFRTTKGVREGNVSFDDRTYIRFET